MSSRISNSPIILNVDCDMYSNNSMSVRDALCFFMDEEKGNEVGFIQFPQAFENLTKNDVYGSSLNVLMEVSIKKTYSDFNMLNWKCVPLTREDILTKFIPVVYIATKLEMPGFDGNGGPCYIGTGCFHRRETLSGQKYSKIYKADWKKWSNRSVDDSTIVLEETCKVLASCSYEENTQWGKEVSMCVQFIWTSYILIYDVCTIHLNLLYTYLQMGLKYDCTVEDVLTGVAIQCRGWRSIYFNPERKGFLGVAPTTLLQSLVQHKRWSEGDFHIFASRHCPFVLGYKKIPLKLQLTYCMNLLWAANCLATLYYVIVPSLCLLRGISLFPEVRDFYFLRRNCLLLLLNYFLRI